MIKVKQDEVDRKFESRTRLYPPSFNKIDAKIIDPIIGASTWALGSHKWAIKIGSFTKKANLEDSRPSQNKFKQLVRKKSWVKKKILWLEKYIKRNKKKGIEAEIV